MATDWYYFKGDQYNGPVGPQQLQNLAATGHIEPTDLVWKEGMANPQPASKLKGLFEASIAPPPVRVTTPPPLPPPPPLLPSPPPLPAQAGTEPPSMNAQFPPRQWAAALSVGTDALKAFKTLALNPVGGMKVAFDNLGAQRAMMVGVAFGIALDLSIVAGLGFSRALADQSFEVVLKVLILGLVPLGSATVGCTTARKVFRGHGNVQSDIFIAGASLLPFAVPLLAIGILGLGNIEIVIVIGVFASTTAILMMYSGCTTVQGISDAAATLCVPLMIVADAYAAKIIVMSLLGH